MHPASPRGQAAVPPPVIDFEGSFEVQAPKKEFQWNVARMFRRQAAESTEHAVVVGLLSFCTGSFILAALSDFLIRGPLYLAGKIDGKSWSLIDKVTPPLKALAQKVGCFSAQKLLRTDEERSQQCLLVIEENIEQYVKQSGKNGNKGLRDEAFQTLHDELEIYFKLKAKSVGSSLDQASRTLQDLLEKKVAAHTKKANGEFDKPRFNKLYPKINAMFQEVRAERFIKLAENEDDFIELLNDGLKPVDSHEPEDENVREAYLSREQLSKSSVRTAIVADVVRQASKGGIELNGIEAKVNQTFAPLEQSIAQHKLARMKVKALSELKALKTAQDQAAEAKAEKKRLKNEALTRLSTFLTAISDKTNEINGCFKAIVRRDKKLKIISEEIRKREELIIDCQIRKQMVSKNVKADEGGFTDTLELDETIAIHSEYIEQSKKEIEELSGEAIASNQELSDKYTDLIKTAAAYELFREQNSPHIGKTIPASLIKNESDVAHNINRIKNLYKDKEILPDVPKFDDKELKKEINKVMGLEDDDQKPDQGPQLAPPPAAAAEAAPADDGQPAPAAAPQPADQVPVGDAQPAGAAPGGDAQPRGLDDAPAGAPAPVHQADAAEAPAPAPAPLGDGQPAPAAPAQAHAEQQHQPAAAVPPAPAQAPVDGQQAAAPAAEPVAVPLPAAAPAQAPVDVPAHQDDVAQDRPIPAPPLAVSGQSAVAANLASPLLDEDVVQPAKIGYSLWSGLTSMFQRSSK